MQAAALSPALVRRVRPATRRSFRPLAALDLRGELGGENLRFFLASWAAGFVIFYSFLS